MRLQRALNGFQNLLQAASRLPNEVAYFKSSSDSAFGPVTGALQVKFSHT